MDLQHYDSESNFIIMNVRLLLFSFFCLLLSCNSDTESTHLTNELFKISEKNNPTQYFNISAGIDTVLYGIQGTRIYITANSLEFENGNTPTKKITISLKEVYTIAETILNNLSTTSNEQLLETSGMIKLMASSDNKNLNLKPNSSIKLQFKKIVNTPFMRTYTGKKEALKMNWVLDQDNIFDTIKFIEESRYIIPLAYGYDSIANGKTTYGIIASDTIVLRNTPDTIAIKNYLSAIEADKISDHFYTIHTTKLNWINCDFFIDSKDNISVFVKDEETNQVNLIFKEYSSIMSPSSYKDGKYEFTDIPKGSQVTILSLSKKNEDYYLAINDKTLQIDKEFISLNYQKSSITDIEKELDKFDK